MLYEILQELKQPDFLCHFSAQECVKGVYKNHRYVCKPETGEVFKQSDGQKRFPKTIRLNCNEHYAKSVVPSRLDYSVRRKKGYSYIYYPAYTEFQYIEKYDKLVLCTWVCHTQDLNSLTITNGKPNFPIDQNYDGDALFRLDSVEIKNESEDTMTNLITLEMARVFNKDKTFEDYNTNDYKIVGFDGYDVIINNATNIKYVISSLDVCGEFFGNSFIGSNSYAIPNNPDNISAFFRAKTPKVGRSSKKQLVIDELCKKTGPMPKGNSGLVCYVDKLDNEWAVIRWISNDENFEYFRMYVDKKTHLYCRNDGNNRFIYFGGKLSIRTFQADQTIVLNNDAFEGTKLEYFKNIYNEVESKERSGIIYMLLCYPEFEKLYKAGFKSLCLDHVNRHYGYAWPKYLDEAVLPLDVKASSVYQILGVNKYQFDKFKDVRVDIVRSVKRSFNSRDIRDIDNESFDAVFDVIKKTKTNSYFGPAMVFANLSATYSTQTMVNMAPFVDKIAGKRISIKSHYSSYCAANGCYNDYYTEHDAIGALNDCITMIRQLAATHRIKPYFKTLEELGDMHDVLIDAVNADRQNIIARQEAAHKESFKKRSSFWTKWEYDEDSKYVVVAPKAPVDIAEEGITLRHCVRSFIPKVAEGSTNILFIREKAKPDAPFFTVEVLNSGTVRQIHGACNRNVSSEPGLEPFIKKWMKAKKLRSSNYNSCLA